MAPVYTLSQVAEHNSNEDCWVLVDGKVYDVTEFLSQHPGGDDVILACTGKDATDDFEDIGHSQSARQTMEGFRVGDIEPSSIPDKLHEVDRDTQLKYNPNKSGEFIMKILQILVPLVILVLALASRYMRPKEEVAADEL